MSFRSDPIGRELACLLARPVGGDDQVQAVEAALTGLFADWCMVAGTVPSMAFETRYAALEELLETLEEARWALEDTLWR